MIRKVNGELKTESRELRHAFNDMDLLHTPPRSIDALLRGLTDDHSESMDTNFVDDVMNIGLDIFCSLNAHFFTLSNLAKDDIILVIDCSLFV